MTLASPSLLLVLCVAACAGAATVRPPAVAGQFYPGSAAELQGQVDGFLGQAASAAGPPARAVVVPHAGYAYSGPTAGRTFASLKGKTIRRFIVLGPSHHEAFAGGALPAAGIGAFSTPLGEIPLDVQALQKLRGCPDLAGPASAHGPEHSLEVELPFLQRLAPDALLVPVVLGYGSDRDACHRIARCLSQVVDDGTVVVASSDFTHHGRAFGFAPFAGDKDLGMKLVELGRKTAERVAAVDTRGFWYQVKTSEDTVCGMRPIQVLLELLEHAFDGKGRVVDVTTSGHVVGGWDRVVTYAGVTFDGSFRTWRESPPVKMAALLTKEQGRDILELARAALHCHLAHDGAVAEWFANHSVEGPFEAPAGAFVTVDNRGERAERFGKLRACMGVIEARQPLVDAELDAAFSALHDPRFPELAHSELEEVDLEVSVLSPTHQVSGPEEVVVGRDGVVLHKSGRSAVFLPQVAPEQGWDRDTMLTHLARKAGLPSDAWRSGASFEVFTAQVVSEAD